MIAVLRTVNRVLLALTGLALLGLGLAALAAAFDLYGRVGVTPPDGYAWRSPDEVLLTAADRTQWRAEDWWWPVVFAVLGLLVLLALWWLVAQLRSRRLGTVRVDTGDGAGARVRGAALEDAMAAEAEDQHGVGRARVTLTGRRGSPRARVGLLLEPEARPARVVRELRARALEHARTSAGLAALPAQVRLRASRHRAERLD
ncbi:alkaline shock response membrane anchor protein AmaP [Streptomyces sp. TRM 70351]|uniref:alkaline shock response membrane anchor protein AmaP n=1 Tax=Streptomyces sp. TRM 70351 TaxID=3116552 RepID=UPI002E7C1417|nr:alkaline shock response membrane anchor protein AmaP [Streptomyces sp. TRM 70351]MEE1930624.1 alkaline shock response membrane anchor protein AmaP [Streptomyces sp. TRM 70351]